VRVKINNRISGYIETDVETVANTAEVLDPADPVTETVDVHQ